MRVLALRRRNGVTRLRIMVLEDTATRLVKEWEGKVDLLLLEDDAYGVLLSIPPGGLSLLRLVLPREE